MHLVCFDFASDFFPSACLGVVAKVVKARRSLALQSGEQENGPGQIPAMIETTAAVHPGGSGGAVVNSDGHMIGLVTRYSIYYGIIFACPYFCWHNLLY